MFKDDKFLSDKEMAIVKERYNDIYQEAHKVKEVYTLLKSRGYTDLKINVVLHRAPVCHMLKTIFKFVPKEDLKISGTDDITISHLGTIYRGIGYDSRASLDIVNSLVPYFKKELARLEMSKSIPNGVRTGKELAIKLRDAKGFLVPEYDGDKYPQRKEINVVLTDDKIYIASVGKFEHEQKRAKSMDNILKFEADAVSIERAREIAKYFFENRVR